MGKKPPRQGGESRPDECHFWSRVSPTSLARVVRAFRRDLAVLGYSASDYLRGLGLQVPKEVLEAELDLEEEQIVF